MEEEDVLPEKEFLARSLISRIIEKNEIPNNPWFDIKGVTSTRQMFWKFWRKRKRQVSVLLTACGWSAWDNPSLKKKLSDYKRIDGSKRDKPREQDESPSHASKVLDTETTQRPIDNSVK